MLHNMGYDCFCERCNQPKTFDEIVDAENGMCEECYDKWFASEYAFWKPLYDGEKLAGFRPNKDRTPYVE